MESPIKLLNDVKWATRQRLQFIETMAYYTGLISRSGLAKAFGISDPAATKDLKLYNELAPGNLKYSPSVFGFVPTDNFQPMVADLDPKTVLPMIAQNLISIDNPSGNEPVYGISVDQLPLPTRLPSKEILSQIIRAIKNRSQLSVIYRSLSDRDSKEIRIIEPHALANNGLRWHVRAYSQDTYDYRDFVLSRITEASQFDEAAESSPDYDDDWTEIVTIQLKPHPGLTEKQHLTLKYDYNMENGVIELTVRRALVAYIIHQMSVDTTADYSMNPNAYQLVIVNRDEIEPYAGWAFL